MRLEVHPINPQSRFVKQAAEIFDKDGLVLYPTESGYAIGCSAESTRAIHRLYQLKKPMKKFVMAIILPDIRRASEYAHVSNFAFQIMKHRVPGPYTFILPADPSIARKLDVKRPEVGFRMPEHPFFKELFRLYDKPILSTAAKLSDDEIFTDPEDLWKLFEHKIDLMIDCGNIDIHPTNIISLVGNTVEVIRGELLPEP
ncbi:MULTISPECIES: L-threonylcarbamoyladenylate synthase [Fibrobacter]|uniref:Translation factor SUA5 n=1 Tax=Fibrobacter intestinalis TaxID=28122 RepID=A0A1M6UI17_9BACT|nr:MULTISPECIES: L-threonylcarbamoyladenylate synthase [Fibrobacter]MDD7298272.1 L-threonylcarbamoyladenylate synthase [Fibrobacter intestinalis]PBC67215.1 translation factor SUA5 [Fibrobacter sp. UWS1]PBC73273.1 translation factor SUA5 [Fibrobacter sp. NR9]SHK68819.1 translation factor SUA5 [Fibrobacter intestinalis]SJZ82680.1 translation factor SUA5 [Fibrobacter intestinalis]